MTDKNDVKKSSRSGTPPPDTLNEAIGVLIRREVEARILAPVIEALGSEFGREKVIAALRDTIVKIAREQGAALRRLMGGDSLKRFYESLQFWTKDNALEINLIEQTDEAFSFNGVLEY